MSAARVGLRNGDQTMMDNDGSDSQDTTLACAECDSAQLKRTRSSSMNRRSDTNAPEHWCKCCQKAVEPNERPADPSGGCRQGPSKLLADMDAEQVGR